MYVVFVLRDSDAKNTHTQTHTYTKRDGNLSIGAATLLPT
jgi:hypothetical protein